MLYMYEKFRAELTNIFKSKYENFTMKDFSSFYDELIPQLAEFQNVLDKEVLVNNFKLKAMTTKSRWVKKIITNTNLKLGKDIEFARIQYSYVLNNTLEREKFENFFEASNIEDYIEKKTVLITAWKKDSSALLIDFEYMSELNKKSIVSAFKNDIFLTFLKMCTNYESNNKKITKIPSILSSIPIDTTSKVFFLNDEDKDTLEQSLTISSPSTIDKLIMVPEEEQDEILMQLEMMTYLEIKRGGRTEKFLDMMTQIALLKSIKYLDSFDSLIIRYYYNHLEKMVLGEPIDKSIYQVIKDLKLSNTLASYERIENSLAKIGSINLSYNIEGNSIHGNLLGCMIYEDNGSKRAAVYLGQILQAMALKESTFEYDTETFNSLSADSQQLAIWLQKRRYRIAIHNDSIYFDTIGLGLFSTAIYWNTKRKDRQRNRIIESLQELQDKSLIIQNFSYDKKLIHFKIEYIPLSPRELNKLDVNTSSNNTILNVPENIVINHSDSTRTIL